MASWLAKANGKRPSFNDFMVTLYPSAIASSTIVKYLTLLLN